jgi:hypothetical protein
MRLLSGGLALLAFVLFCSACGYVGDPLPPALNIAETITDLRAIQRGDRILIDFTVPELTTEGLPVRKPVRIDLRAGPSSTPFSVETWLPDSVAVPANGDTGPVHVTAPASNWYGRDLVIGVRLLNNKGRLSDWSNLVTIAVTPPLAVPSNFIGVADPKGISLTWNAAPREKVQFRIFRRAEDEKQAALLATVDTPSYVDTATTLGKRYEYSVQSVLGAAESEPSPLVTVLSVDVFRPEKPAGLTAVGSLNSIELGWERNAEPDLAHYRIYRAENGGQFTRLADVEQPAFSDKQLTAGTTYRYALTAIDQAGNESDRSDSIEAVAP